MPHKKNFLILFASFIFISQILFAADSENTSNLNKNITNHDTTFYKDFFDQIIYYPLSKPLRWDRLTQHWFGRKESLDINIFDEVPDSSFFQNRHGRKLMSVEELKAGPNQAGPSEGKWTVLKGKSEGVSAGFMIRDSKGTKFLLKLDPADNPEMATSTEIIGHKFFYAFGYHVPQYNLVRFKVEDLTLDPKATYYNEEGFQKPLDQNALNDLLKKAPIFKGGIYQAAASRYLKGTPKGFLLFEGVRKGDPDDLIPHEDRRTIRALRVFSSWLNHYDLRVGNSLDMIVEENGKTFLKHYMIDFGSLFGSAGSHIKYPAAVHENVIDWHAIGDAFAIFRFQDKKWEKRWDTNERQVTYSSIGYFDNIQFTAQDWHSQLPYEAFNRLSEADAYWAAKIISKFSNEMIEVLVKTGGLSDPDAEKYLTKTLIDRRDLVTQYWFSKVVPLENLKLSKESGNSYKLTFEDLGVVNGFDKSEEIAYQFRIGSGAWQEFKGNELTFTLEPSKSNSTLWIRKKTRNSSWTKLPIRIHFEKSSSDQTFRLSGIERGHLS